MNSFGSSSKYKCIETNKNRMMTYVLKRWNKNKCITHPSTCAFTPAETVALKIYSIELK